jgi:hypothetical protein
MVAQSSFWQFSARCLLPPFQYCHACTDDILTPVSVRDC